MTETQLREMLGNLVAQVEMDVVEGLEEQSTKTMQLIEDIVFACKGDE